MMIDKIGIEIYTTPPYKSQANGKVAKFHSTLIEIMCCIKYKGGHRNSGEILERATSEHNHSVHSTKIKRPVDLFYNRNVTFTSEDMKELRTATYKN